MMKTAESSQVEEGANANESDPLYQLRWQTGVAKGAAVLSTVVSLSMAISNLPGNRVAIQKAHEQVALHEELLKSEMEALRRNQQALEQINKALEKLRERKNE